MRILLHDYGQFPFSVELARSLARRGHELLYAYNKADSARAHLAFSEEERRRLEVVGVEVSQPLLKQSFYKRRQHEVAEGHAAAKEIDRFRPDVVISANTPLDAQSILLKRTRERGAKFVYWVQDLIGIATDKILRKRLPIVGAVVGHHYVRMEQSLIRQSDQAVLITEAFRPILHDWGVRPERVHVVENWSPLDQLPMRPRDNEWAARHGLQDKLCVVYAGTMGMKHNPELILELARSLTDKDDVRVVVVSEGSGVDWLRQQQEKQPLRNLVMLPFQPFEVMPDVLATADVLVAVLEPSAGVFSVPSKVLTYLCGGRPLLLAVPLENLAARIVEENRAGLVVAPSDIAGFTAAAGRLLADESLRRELARGARHYAETHFDIDAITDKFETVLAAK
ncbi:MAG TPA: glycosyltransferase family 4 protein [Armatimonadota bacterium]|nr:glycosyltransferase family 4 protein [Armatimonadota bacterium]